MLKNLAYYCVFLLSLLVVPCSLGTAATPAKESFPSSLTSFIQDFGRTKGEAEKILRHVWYFSRDSQVDPLEVLAIISVESEFNPKAVSADGSSIGLMQINTPAHKINKQAVASIRDNLKFGIDLLSKYKQMARSQKESWRMYNTGPGTARRCKSCGKEYTQKVQEKYWFLKQQDFHQPHS